MNTVQWYLENRIILVEYIEYVDNTENFEVFQAVYALLEQTQYADVLVDFTRTVGFSVSIQKNLENDFLQKCYAHPSLGWIITIAGQHKFYFHLISSYIERHFGVKRQVVETFEEAIAFLEKIHTTPSDTEG